MDHPTPRPGRARPRALRLALTLVVAVVAVTTGAAEHAAAAPPVTLTATPAPVVIPFGQTTGTYDLAFSTGLDAVPATVSVAVDNGPQVPFPMGVASGSIDDVAISIGQTHTWRLYGKAPRVPLRTITVTTRRPDQSCLSQCIKDVKVTPHGSYADVAVIATGPLKSYTLDVWSLDGNDAGMAGVAGTQWTTTAWHLTPDELYTYTLKVWDEAGNQQTVSGTFTTLRPRVKVTFDSISVGDDSDELSEGEITWIFRAGDFWDPTSPIDTAIDSGETFFPGYADVVEPDTADLVIALYGADDDFEPVPWEVTACGAMVWPEQFYDPGHGSNTCGEWATAYTAVPVLVDGVGESFTAPFTLGVSEELSFLAQGTYTVTYV